MAFFSMETEADLTGPVLNAQAGDAISGMLTGTEEELAETGVRVVRSTLHPFLQHPTGYYESQIQADRRGGDSVTHDGGVVYGPWLAGTGSRNAPATSFEGYPHWRLSTRHMDRLAEDVAAREAAEFVRRMNG